MSSKALSAYRKGCGGKGMTYKGYAAFAKAEGEEPMSEDKYNEEAEEGREMPAAGGEGEGEKDEETEEKEEKSEVNANDLLKSIEAYDAVEAAMTQAGTDRESYLTARFRDGTISKAEQSELGKLWSGEVENTENDAISKSVTDHLREEDAEAAGLVDASDFLAGLVKSLDSALSGVRTSVTRDSDATRTLLKAQGSLLKSVAVVIAGQDEIIKAQGAIIDALGKRIGVVERTPTVRKSHGSDPRDIAPRSPGRDLGRGDGEGNRLSKADVFNGLDILAKSAAEKGDDAAMQRIAHATALFESSGQIHPNMLAAINAVREANN